MAASSMEWISPSRSALSGPPGRSRNLTPSSIQGFSGALTLPKDLAAALSLVRSGGCTAILADGSVVESRVYHAVVQIDDVQTEVRVVEVPDAPLIGMELLKGFRVQFDVKPDGEVIVYRLP